MASVEKRGKKWLVRWRDPDGTSRARRCPDAETARRLRLEVERALALGRAWEPADAHTQPALVEVVNGEPTGLFSDFLEARRARLAPGTRRHYDRALKRFSVHLADRNPRRRRLTVDLLTRDALEGWFGSLVDDRLPADERLGVASARLLVTAVYSAWTWAYDSDAYGSHVARPRRIEMPVAPTAPPVGATWAEMDAAIAAAYGLASGSTRHAYAWLWRARLLTLLRFTGLRVDEQAMRLRWDDVDLTRAELVVRGELGKSGPERAGRRVPLSPHLVELLAGWGVREGYLVAPDRVTRHAPPRFTRTIWLASKVPERVWGVAPGRSKGNVHHVFRKGFKTELSRLGVASDVRDYLVGHHRGIDEHYLDTYEQAVEAVRKIPPLADAAAAGEVIHLSPRRSQR